MSERGREGGREGERERERERERENVRIYRMICHNQPPFSLLSMKTQLYLLRQMNWTKQKAHIDYWALTPEVLFYLKKTLWMKHVSFG